MESILSVKVISEKGLPFGLLYWSVPPVIFFLGLIVFLRNKNSSTSRTLFHFSIVLIVWAILTPFYMSTDSKLFGLFAARTANAIIFWAAPVYYHLCKVFPRHKGNFSRGEIIGILINALLALITVFTGFIVVETRKYDWGMNGINGPGFALGLIWFSVYILVSVRLLYRKLRHTTGRTRSQIQYMLLALFILFIYFFPICLLYPLITGQSKYDYYGPLGIIFFIGFIYYAIIKHRLMDIRAFVFKSLAYTLTLLAIAGVYISIFYLAIDQLSRVMNPLFNIALLLVFVLTFHPLRKLIEKPLDKVFAKNRYDFEALLKKISTILSNNLVLDHLSKKLLNCLSADMKISSLSFVLANGYCKIFEIATLRQGGARNDDPGDTISQNDASNQSKTSALIKMAQPNKALVADELEDDDSKKELMRNLGVEVLVYYYDEERVLGFLALSEKESGDAFSAQDLKLLEIIAPQVSIALKNIEQQQQMIEQIIEERHRIDQDAHDRIYNRLGALAKKAELAEVNPKEAQKTLSLLKTDLRVAVDDLQRIVKGETDKQQHDNNYIIDELKKICEDFKNQSSIKLDFNCACDSLQLIDPKNLWHFQCILEECLNNIRKHSKATQVNIDIAKENSSIILEVKDNGIGISQHPASSDQHLSSGMGLTGMQERAQKINGTIAVTSNNGSGTKVQLKVPVS